jgi:AcrR family transcriptional regulator
MSPRASRTAPRAQPEPVPAAEPETDEAYRRRPRQSRGQRRVDLLLDAAAAVIAEQGLQAATAEAIAQRAHTAKGSLYQFFPNRDAVVAALAMRYADELRAVHERAFATEMRGLSVERLIDRIVRPLAAFHDRNPAFRRVFATVDAPPDSTGSAPLRLRGQLFARNPSLGTRERRRAAMVCATIGQALLAKRDRAASGEKKPILDELRRVLAAYLTPLLDRADA